MDIITKSIPGTGTVRSLFGLLLLVGLLIPASRSQAQEKQKTVARFISVSNSITSEIVKRIEKVTALELRRFKQSQAARPVKDRFLIIFDFNPEGAPNTSTQFGICLELAREIQELQKEGAEVLAFVHGTVKGHSILPVLACRTIVMSRDAELGPVADSPKEASEIPQFKVDAYTELVPHRPKALLKKLFDPDLVVVRGKTKRVVAQGDPDAVVGAAPLFGFGEVASFSFLKARAIGLCEQDPLADRAAVVKKYRLSRQSVYPLLSHQDIVPARIVVDDVVDGKLKESLIGRMRRAAQEKANLLLLELRCHGGDPEVAYEIASEISEFNENHSDHDIMIVGYYTAAARSTAIYLALACDYFVIHPKATVGDMGEVLMNRSAQDRKTLGEAIAALARKQLYPVTLVQGLVDNTKEMDQLFHVVSVKGQRREAIITARQLDNEREQWGQAVPINRNSDSFIVLSATDAEHYGLARKVEDDLNKVLNDLGVDPAKVKLIESDWLEDLADFLRSPWASFLLVMVGITCLILEMKMPGVGLPGVIAAVCFVIFFWSHSQVLQGRTTWLAILLFVLGVIFLILEIFVLPGFTICGLSGILLTIGSMGLMAYGHWPSSDKEWGGFFEKLAPYGFALVGALVCAVILAKYLPQLPFLNRLLLQPPSESDPAMVEEMDATQARLASLLGAIGMAATPLRPAGKVQFGEEFVDVVAEGSYIVPGTRVQVIEVEGNRVVVKEV